MQNHVLVYTNVNCPYCDKVKQQLKEWGVDYEERNVSESREYLQHLQEKGLMGVPATFIGENKPILGFQPEKMKKLLMIAN